MSLILFRGEGVYKHSVLHTYTLIILYKHTFGVGGSVPLIGTTSMALLSGVSKENANITQAYLSFILCWNTQGGSGGLTLIPRHTFLWTGYSRLGRGRSRSAMTLTMNGKEFKHSLEHVGACDM